MDIMNTVSYFNIVLIATLLQVTEYTTSYELTSFVFLHLMLLCEIAHMIFCKVK